MENFVDTIKTINSKFHSKFFDGNVWFIADEDNELMHLYKMPLEKVKSILGECRHFEYYVVAEDLS